MVIFWLKCVILMWVLIDVFFMFAGIEQPTPKATLTGHKSEVTCVNVLAELGMVISGSKGR